MQSRHNRSLGVARLYTILAFLLVHASSVAGQAPTRPAAPAGKSGAVAGQPKGAVATPVVTYGTDKLPAPVIDMREAILAAVHSGRIEDLKTAIELNEMKPDFAAGVADPIAQLRSLSADGTGLDILAALSLALEAGYAILPLGRDVENNRLYVWPYHAELPLDALTPGQEVELLRLVPAGEAKAMKEKKTYTGWRIAIGADGTWHSFGRKQ